MSYRLNIPIVSTTTIVGFLYAYVSDVVFFNFVNVYMVDIFIVGIIVFISIPVCIQIVVAKMSTFTVEGDVCLLKIGINKFSIIIKFDIAQFPVSEIVIRELRFFFLLLTGG